LGPYFCPGERLLLIQSRDEATATGAEIASYVVLMLAIPIVLYFHLLSTALAGLTVHVLTIELARRLPVQWEGMEHKFALAGLRDCNLDQLSPEHRQVINQFGLSEPKPQEKYPGSSSSPAETSETGSTE